MKLIDEVKNGLIRYPNVQMVSNSLKPRIRNGKILEEEQCIRVYVTRKMDEVQLKKELMLPKTIRGLPVDVVESDEIYALQVKQEFHRPMKGGLSFGNENITTGTFGWPMEKKGEKGLGSNGHVVTSDPSLPPEKFKGDLILSPGPHDGGTKDQMAGKYRWHKQVEPSNSNCILSKGVAKGLNGISKLFGRGSRFKVTQEQAMNHIDFGVTTKETEVTLECWEFNPVELGYPFTGFVFAGSSRIGGICKANPYILDEGWHPVGVPVAEKIQVGDKLRKTGRTSCDTFLKVIDESVLMKVNYLSYIAPFDDVIAVDNPNGELIKGGDSGSSAWHVDQK